MRRGRSTPPEGASRLRVLRPTSPTRGMTSENGSSRRRPGTPGACVGPNRFQRRDGSRLRTPGRARERPAAARRPTLAGGRHARKRLRAFSSDNVTVDQQAWRMVRSCGAVATRCCRRTTPPPPMPGHRCAGDAGLAPPTAHPAAHPLIGGCAVCAVRRWGARTPRMRALRGFHSDPWSWLALAPGPHRDLGTVLAGAVLDGPDPGWS